jgi:hypothetical protein
MNLEHRKYTVSGHENKMSSHKDTSSTKEKQLELLFLQSAHISILY